MLKNFHLNIFLTILVIGCVLSVADATKKVIFCYWGTWAYYRHGNGKFQPANIDVNLCTHIGYTFFGIDNEDQMRILDFWLDVDLENIRKTVALKQKNANLKVLASVGGWNEGSRKYSAMASDSSRRAKFISSVVSFLTKWGFDGLDLDWEYPGQRGGSTADRTNFVTLLKELKSALSGHNFLLTIAVAAAEPSASISYDIRNVAQNVDLINVMTYDFNGAWNNVLGHNAPLLGNGPNTVKAAIEYWLHQGAPANKLILGIPLYGRTFTLADPSQTSIGSRSNGAGQAGPYTREAGFLGYNEICEYNKDWTRQWDSTEKVPYAYKANQWVTYDDPQSITEKINYMKSLNLGGAMVWSIETDDFHGVCGGGVTFPLLRAINSIINNGEDTGTATTTTTTRKTNTPTLSTTTISTTTSVVVQCSKDGFFVQPNNCSHFYRCANGVRHDFKCPAGLYFDASLAMCNWPELVKCNA